MNQQEALSEDEDDENLKWSSHDICRWRREIWRWYDKRDM